MFIKPWFRLNNEFAARYYQNGRTDVLRLDDSKTVISYSPSLQSDLRRGNLDAALLYLFGNAPNGIEEHETALMFGAYIRDIIENEAAGAAEVLARGMADIFERHAAEGGRDFDKAEFLRIALAGHDDNCASLDSAYDPRPCDCFLD